jgi:hypothetical protein
VGHRSGGDEVHQDETMIFHVRIIG